MIGKLWLCGSKKLNLKLSEGGGLRSFYFTSELQTFWPKLASNLPHLCSFSFICGLWDSVYTFAASDILSLPPSVRNLDLGFYGVLKTYTEALLTSPDHFKHLKQLTLRPGVHEKSVHLVPDLLHNLPWGLEALDLRGLSHLSSEDQPFPFESVPQTLTSLGVSTNRLETNSLAALPPTLTKLHIRFFSGNDVEWMKLLPRGMVDCEILHSNWPTNVPEQDWNHLPRSLTLLAFSYPHLLKVEQVAGLPRGLLMLDIVESQTSDVAVIEALPPNLRGLFGFFKEPISAPQAKALPRTLIHIQADVSWHALSYLPSGIKNIKTTYQKNTGEPPVSLPNGLQEFTMLGSVLSSEFPTLPEGLETFKSEYSLDPDMTSRLPHSLTSLSTDTFFLRPLSLASLSTNTPPAQTGLREMVLEFLPPRLTYLSQIRVWDWTMITRWCASSSKILPRTLTELHLGTCIFESGWGRGLPNGLKTLRLQVDQIERGDVSDISQTCTGITSFTLKIQKATASRTSFSDLVDVLPRGTELLEISFDEAKDEGLQDHHLQGLPPKLVHLHLSECPNLSLACTPYLPKSLRNFRMGYRTVDWFHPMPW